MPLMFRYLAALVFFICCMQAGVAGATPPLKIFVSIPPQKYLVERIGAEHVDVRIMLNPGDSPETFDPSPGKLRELTAAQIYFQIGVPFEQVWMETISAGNGRLEIVACCAAILQSQSAGHDNHVWTSPRNALAIAAQIKDRLSAHDPQNAAEYENNYQALAADLRQLDAHIIKALGSRRTSYFIISHASLGHYAAHYGLTQLSLEKNGRQLGAKGLARLIDKAQRERLDILFVQKQHHSPGEAAFVGELGVQVVEIDPLAEDYIVGLQQLTKAIAQAVE